MSAARAEWTWADGLFGDTVEIPVIDGEVVEDYGTTRIPLIRDLPPVPQQSARVAARLPLSARVARRRRMFLGSAFIADLVERRYTVAGCALILLCGIAVAVLTRGLYWTDGGYAPIPLDLTR